MEMATKLSISKDLGQRPIELTWLTIKDIDLTTGIVSITGAKHTIGREGKLKTKSLELLKILIKTRILMQTTTSTIAQAITYHVTTVTPETV